MGRSKRRAAVITGAREARAIAATLGREARATRRRRRLTQATLGDMVGLGQSEISHLERGHGGGTSIETWVAIGMALDRPIAIGFSREIVEPLRDAGHLAADELLLRLATAGGWTARVEAPSRPDEPRHATDVVLERPNATVLIEIWNRLDDLGGALRSTDRKLAESSARGGAVASCWILVDTEANRAIVRSYPAILRTRFDAPSAAWLRSITTGGSPPARPGLLWIEPRSGRLRPVRPARPVG